MSSNNHLCLDWHCPICHPSGGGVVDNSEQLSTTGEAVVDNSEPLYPDAQVNGPFYYSLYLEEKLRRAHDLIHWFSTKWGDDLDPLFPWRDEYTKTDLPGNRRLCDTWYEVVRRGVVCENCEGTRGVRKSTDQDRVFTFEPCESCGGRGFFPFDEIDA